MSYRTGVSVRLLRLILGAFFIILGITGLFRELPEGIFGLQTGYNWLEVVFGVTEIICGILILLGFFIFSDSRPVYWGSFIVLIFWIARIILSRFFWGFNFIYRGQISIPSFFSWLLALSCELIIAAALFVIVGRYE